MEEFFRDIFGFFSFIWPKVEWAFDKLTRAFDLTIDFIVANGETHTYVMFFILFISILYLTYDGTKKKETREEKQSTKYKTPPPKADESSPEKFTLQFYDITEDMKKEDKCRELRKAFSKYNQQQSSAPNKLKAEDAGEHKQAITSLQTKLGC